MQWPALASFLADGVTAASEQYCLTDTICVNCEIFEHVINL